jgi:hypothetical protein
LARQRSAAPSVRAVHLRFEAHGLPGPFDTAKYVRRDRSTAAEELATRLLFDAVFDGVADEFLFAHRWGLARMLQTWFSIVFSEMKSSAPV